MNRYSAKFLEAYSADDFAMQIEVGFFGLSIRSRVRLHGVDAPDAYRKHPGTPAGELRLAVKAMLADAKIALEIVTETRGSLICQVYYLGADGVWICLNQWLQDRGYLYVR